MDSNYGRESYNERNSHNTENTKAQLASLPGQKRGRKFYSLGLGTRLKLVSYPDPPSTLQGGSGNETRLKLTAP